MWYTTCRGVLKDSRRLSPILQKGVMLMSDYELLMIVLAIITLVVTVLMNANKK